MQNYELDQAMINYVSAKIEEYRKKFFNDCDLICFYGSIDYRAIDIWNNQIVRLVEEMQERGRSKLVIFLRTSGGSAEVVEKLVDITRSFYDEVYFVIPEYAMSAGTIWVMSANKIYMCYASSLGPIDPQVLSSDNKWVPAMGYLDKVNEIIGKSKKNEVSQAELMMLSQLDLANLRRYEQAVELSVELLKKWLTKYKFAKWDKHMSNSPKKGRKVTEKEKEQRAHDIARLLSDNKIWHSHGRFIGVRTVTEMLKLKVEDYTNDTEMVLATRNLNVCIMEHIGKNSMNQLIYISDPRKPESKS